MSSIITADYVSQLRKNALEAAVKDLVRMKTDNPNSKITKKTYENVKSSLEEVGVVIKLDALYKRVSRAFDKINKVTTPVQEVDVSPQSEARSQVSDLSSSPNNDRTSTPTSGTNETMDNNGSTIATGDNTFGTELPRKEVGRPKGTTDSNKAKSAKRFCDCIVDITYDYATQLAINKELSVNGQVKRNKKGFLANMIVQKKLEWGVPHTVYISEETIMSRVKRGCYDPDRRGGASPLAEAEEALVQICIQMGKIRQPLNVNEGVKLMNDLIKDTHFEEMVAFFQCIRRLGKEEKGFKYGQVTKGWWRGFLRRHGDRIVTKRGEKFAQSRDDWTKYPPVFQMYRVIYDEMVDAGIAVEREIPVYVDREGNEVEESERFGFKEDIKIVKPTFLLFADECGFNTSQQKDGHVAGTKLIVARGTVPQTISSTTDHRFTMLPFTSASGEAVCCVIIFQSDTGQVPQLWKTGIDHSVAPIKFANGKLDVESNVGEGKYMPGGPKCIYNNKVVDCQCYASSSGGITGEILVEILDTFDKMNLFPRLDGGPIPMMIIDGHQSRLDPQFIEYINDKGHRWKVCLGVPYATSLWQVGDASEQNGSAKTEWYREKAKLVLWKYEHPPLSRCIGPEDIIPLVNKIFHKAYGNVPANKKAVADRGWYPANRKLLEHPSLIPDEEEAPPSNPASSTATNAPASMTLEDGLVAAGLITAATPTPNTSTPGVATASFLNINTGMGATVLDRMLTARARSDGAKKAAEKRKQEGEGAAANIKNAKRLTAGVLTANGVHSLDDPAFLNPFRERQAENNAKKQKTKDDNRKKLKKRISGVKSLRQKYGPDSTLMFAAFTKDECGVYLQYKKQAKDPGMPKDVTIRRQRCIEWMTRPSPTASPHESDVEDDEAGGDVSNSVAAAAAAGNLNLLTLASDALNNLEAVDDWMREDQDGEEDDDGELHSAMVGA